MLLLLTAARTSRLITQVSLIPTLGFFQHPHSTLGRNKMPTPSVLPSWRDCPVYESPQVSLASKYKPWRNTVGCATAIDPLTLHD
ncbi:hypothetical protein GGR57DRAFT_484327 [Xylariaceae sp. FL1272]|nr:hypothetical protein GGR57DRAFT_484327 [Xylariaceae sp. FL1272]